MIPPTYYRSQLQEDEKNSYRLLVMSLLSLQSDIELPCSPEVAKRIIFSVHLDHPELFYVNFHAYTISSRLVQLRNHCCIHFNMLCDRVSIEAIQNALRESALELMESMGENDSEMSRYIQVINKLKTCNRYQNTDSLFRDHTIAGPLIYHTSVCEGLSKSFLFYCQRCKLQCALIFGTLDGVPHAWNMIEGGRYIDVTALLNAVFPIKLTANLLPDQIFMTKHEILARGYQWIDSIQVNEI